MRENTTGICKQCGAWPGCCDCQSGASDCSTDEQADVEPGENLKRSAERLVMQIQCVESVIENEIKEGVTQRQIAQTYALALRSSWPTDWKHVNGLIVNRWSARGLERIKKMAWSGSCFESDNR